MEETPVFIDAGPLILLARIGHLDLLRGLFGKVFLTAAVADEALPGGGRPGEGCIASAIDAGFLVNAGNPPSLPGLSSDIDPGERSVIEAAVAVPGSLAIIDDGDARKHAAKHGVAVTGTIGVLLMAKEDGLLASVGEALQELIEGGMYVSPALVKTAILRAGEAISPQLAEKLK